MEDKNWEPSGIVWGSDSQDADTAAQEDASSQDISSHDGFGSKPHPALRREFRSRGGGRKRSPLKTIGTVLLVLFVLSLLSRACGKKDAASAPKETEASQTGTETAQPKTDREGQAETSAPAQDERKDRNGYRPETNEKLSYGGIQFGIPSYFRKNESEDQSLYIFNASDPSGKTIEAQLEFSGGIPDNLSENYIEEKGDSLQDTLVKALNESGRKPEVSLSENITIAGRTARHVMIHGTLEEETVTIHAVFLVNPQNDRLISIILISLDNAYYDYTNDFYKILKNAAAEEVKKPEEEHEDASGEEPAASDELDPDFKKMMDDYEAFFDRYVEFMKKYEESSDTTALLSDYMEFMTQYTEVMSELDALDKDDMNAAEYAYYMEVMARISKKLLEAAQ